MKTYRKVLTVVLSAVLCLAVPLQAFAAYSTTITAYTYGGIQIPAYSGSLSQTVNNNITKFTEEEKQKLEAYESYSPLDSLGRAGVARVNIDQSLMPTESRGSLTYTPTGWKYNGTSNNKQYTFIKVANGYLYHRCHLIAYSLTGENNNKNNLITGTSDFNVKAMEPLEMVVKNYIQSTGNHVLYRVTPVFRGDNLLADGVLIEAESLEDETINICVYCYNVQPGVAINYATGENMLASELEDPDGPDEPDNPGGNLDIVKRIAGSTRYETALGIADELKKTLEIDEFDTIIVAYGKNYPDALAGGYLASLNKAPILTVDTSSESKVLAYIKDNLSSTGKVYILGGTSAVSAGFEKKLKTQSSYDVKRLAGATRYETNIEILKEAGVDDEEILVCSGRGYADSLSASATGRPILLTDTSLNAKQIEYLKTLDSDTYYIIGGTGVVSIDVANTIKRQTKDDSPERIYGANRYETSFKIAKKFFSADTKTMTLAYGQNFPDGLSGGPLAYFNDAPLLLAENTQTKYAADFIKYATIEDIYVFGGVKLISDAAIAKILE